ncbi:MAG: DEAD/DEAH box helicase [Salinivirgaceae bacterium]|nr:MAG: DEAD/DEAH box helicase [Salinivirgaceae bacterium]
MRFDDLNIIKPILKALNEEEYAVPTSIQEKAIPLIIDRKDVLGSAQTGTGKTAAFAIPILQHLYNDRQDNHRRGKIKALVITPTRELAIQIGESFSTYGKHTGIKNTVVFGGVNQGPQTQAIKRGVDILVATPGRLLDLMNQGFIRLRDVEYFVLDEADRMLDMGFINDIKKIIEKLPAKRQSLFFSATMPNNIVALSKKILKNPVKVEINAVSSAADTLKQYLYYTNKQDKKSLLLHILKDRKIDQVLLFSRTKHGADKLAKHLAAKKILSAAIHGDKAQNQRQKALNKFKDGELRVLVATDIAARGIDIDKLKYVINYDIPNLPETYVHRIGRAGRAGDEGISISICEPEENVYVKDIEKLINKRIEVITDNPFPQTDRPMNNAEKKEAAKEKLARKQEYFANKNKKKDKQIKPKRKY